MLNRALFSQLFLQIHFILVQRIQETFRFLPCHVPRAGRWLLIHVLGLIILLLILLWRLGFFRLIGFRLVLLPLLLLIILLFVLILVLLPLLLLLFLELALDKFEIVFGVDIIGGDPKRPFIRLNRIL